MSHDVSGIIVTMCDVSGINVNIAATNKIICKNTTAMLDETIYNDFPKKTLLDAIQMIKLSFVFWQGLSYIHESSLKCHGTMKSSNVVVDGRWACKLTDYGMEHFQEGAETDPEQSDHAKYSSMLLMATILRVYYNAL